MSDEKALLAAIWEHPHEDTPRLVYADWLQETGKPANVARGEFIRVQCERARLDRADDSPRKDELLKREKQLWKVFTRTWREKRAIAFRRQCFERGFPLPEKKFGNFTAFSKLKKTELRRAPLWKLHFRGMRDEFALRMAGSLALSRAHSADFHQPRQRLSLAAFRALVQGKAVHNAARLWLSSLLPGDDSVAALVTADVPHLTFLGMDGNSLTDAGIQLLATWPCAPPLAELFLDQNNLGDASLELLATGPIFRRLESLVLGANPGFTTAGLIRFIRTMATDSLATLHLAGSAAVTADFAEALAASPKSRSLRTLTLPYTQLGDRGVAAILDSPYLTDLRYLNVHNCGLRSRGVVKRLDARFGGYGSGFGGRRLRPAR